MEWFKILGLNEKQQAAYLYLLKNGAQSASDLARGLSEQRTNSYLIVEELVEKSLVEIDESQKVLRYRASNPEQLQKLMMDRQRHLAKQSSNLKQSLPDLVGMYHLTSSESGFAYFEGLGGYTTAMQDMINAKKEVCVFAASNALQDRPDVWDTLLRMLQKRAYAKIKTRIIYEESLKERVNISARTAESLKKSMEARFWGCSQFDGEVALYGNTTILTTYDEKLTSVVIKNKAITTTLQAIFDTAWASAKNG
jgi:sugar-specific transcriptional regulator TrmB